MGNHHGRYRHSGLRAALHLPLWNPFQVLDVQAPAVVTWGHAPGALAALRAWLIGNATAPGTSPVPLSPAAP
jgi:beta-N-acetylhexosaminidase